MKATNRARSAEPGEMSAVNASAVFAAVHEGRAFISLTIVGQLWSMKNGRNPNGRGGTFKNRAAMAFERDFAYQVKPGHRKGLGSLTEPLRAIVTVFYPSRRQDLDCALVYDCLQANGIVANDRYIIEKHEYAEVDANNPRVEITVEEI